MDTYETTIYNAILITGIVLACIIVFFAISVFRNQRKHIEIQRKNFLNEVNLLERERTRIARDLHDELGPLLSVTKIHLRNIYPADEIEQNSLKKVSDNVAHLFERMGQIAINLTPGSLIKKGLHFALKDFLEGLEEVRSKSQNNKSFAKFQLHYQVKSEVDPNMSIHIYRLVQEIVHNTIKHANANMLVIQLKEKDNQLYLYCKDDGKGFSMEEEMETQTGLGLRSLKSRATMLGGKMNCNSTINGGTNYFFEIPLKQNN